MARAIQTLDASAYVPWVLQSALARHPSEAANWVEPVTGTLTMLDVSGFTPLTERLSHAGNEGSEWLSDILRGLFAPLLTECAAWGGDVVAFGGDAMLVLYSGPEHAQRAVASLHACSGGSTCRRRSASASEACALR